MIENNKLPDWVKQRIERLKIPVCKICLSKLYEEFKDRYLTYSQIDELRNFTRKAGFDYHTNSTRIRRQRYICTKCRHIALKKGAIVNYSDFPNDDDIGIISDELEIF